MIISLGAFDGVRAARLLGYIFSVHCVEYTILILRGICGTPNLRPLRPRTLRVRYAGFRILTKCWIGDDAYWQPRPDHCRRSNQHMCRAIVIGYPRISLLIWLGNVVAWLWMMMKTRGHNTRFHRTEGYYLGCAFVSSLLYRCTIIMNNSKTINDTILLLLSSWIIMV